MCPVRCAFGGTPAASSSAKTGTTLARRYRTDVAFVPANDAGNTPSTQRQPQTAYKRNQRHDAMRLPIE